MLTIKDLVKLYNNSNQLIIAANTLTTSVRTTIEDPIILKAFTDMARKIIDVDECLKSYALNKADELSCKTENLN